MAHFAARAGLALLVSAAMAAVGEGAMIFGSSLPTSPYLGVSAPLVNVAMMKKDTTAGLVTIVSDKAFEVTNFTYDGMAPSAYWITAASTSPADLEKYMKLNPDRVATSYTNADLIVPVSSNVSWADLPFIGLYCTEYKALFGAIDLKAAASAHTLMTGGMAMAPSMSVTAGGRKFL